MLKRFTIILAILIITAVSERPAFADTVTLVADEWCPYNCAPGASKPGILIEIAKQALEKAGHKVVYSNMPWARAIQSARQGEFSGIVGAAKDDAPDFVYSEKAPIQSGNSFFIKSGATWRYKDFSSLDQISLGVIRDYAYVELINNYIAKNAANPARVQIASGETALDINVKKLLGGRIGAVIEDNFVMHYFLKENGLESKVVEAGSLEKTDIYVAFSPKEKRAAEYAKLISETITKLESDGTMKQIKANYGF